MSDRCDKPARRKIQFSIIICTGILLNWSVIGLAYPGLTTTTTIAEPETTTATDSTPTCSCEVSQTEKCECKAAYFKELYPKDVKWTGGIVWAPTGTTLGITVGDCSCTMSYDEWERSTLQHYSECPSCSGENLCKGPPAVGTISDKFIAKKTDTVFMAANCAKLVCETKCVGSEVVSAVANMAKGGTIAVKVVGLMDKLASYCPW